MLCNVPLGACPSDLTIHHGVVMSGSALTPSHENGSPWLATLPRTERMNAKAAKVAKGAAVAAGDGRPAQPADRHRRFGSGNEWPCDSGHSFPGPSPPVCVASRRRRRPLPRLKLIATLAVTRGGQLCDLSGLCVHRRGCDRSLTRPWGEQSVAFSEQDTEDRRKN